MHCRGRSAKTINCLHHGAAAADLASGIAFSKRVAALAAFGCCSDLELIDMLASLMVLSDGAVKWSVYFA